MIGQVNGGGQKLISWDVRPGTLTPIEDDVIITDDPFSDISSGPIL